MPKKLLESAVEAQERVRSGKGAVGEVVGNRLVQGVSTVGFGGSIAYFVYAWASTRWPEIVSEESHTHFVAIVIFLWQTAIFLLGYVGQMLGAVGKGLADMWEALISRVRK